MRSLNSSSPKLHITYVFKFGEHAIWSKASLVSTTHTLHFINFINIYHINELTELLKSQTSTYIVNNVSQNMNIIYKQHVKLEFKDRNSKLL